MSPAKERPRWSRDLDEDEVLLEFDSAISEVLPATTRVRRCLSYPVTNEEREEELESEDDQREDEGVEEDQEEDMEQELEVVPEQEAPLEPQSHRNSNSNSHQLSHQQQASIHLAGLRLPQGLSISLV